MALSEVRTPMRKLFPDVDSSPSTTQLSMEELLDRICKLQISKFREKYQFDLEKMQPCGGESEELQTNTEGHKLRHCWSWESVDAACVPAFYHPCIARSRKLVRNVSPVSMPTLKTHLRSSKKSRDDSAQINTFFRTTKRSSSLVMDSKHCEASPNSHRRSRVPTRKSAPD
ncbi:unnamed protein product, partial [Rodentolepis nana]|uniref:CDI domain-containing protein n=1 Tax=Rodentolepis nana TaxID=102285 RepID=A0A0R3TU17_RODNA